LAVIGNKKTGILMQKERGKELLGVKLSTIYQWTHIGFIPHMKLCRFVRFREQEVLKWLESKSVKGKIKKGIEIQL